MNAKYISSSELKTSDFLRGLNVQTHIFTRFEYSNPQRFEYFIYQAVYIRSLMYDLRATDKSIVSVAFVCVRYSA